MAKYAELEACVKISFDSFFGGNPHVETDENDEEKENNKNEMERDVQ